MLKKKKKGLDGYGTRMNIFTNAGYKMVLFCFAQLASVFGHKSKFTLITVFMTPSSWDQQQDTSPSPQGFCRRHLCRHVLQLSGHRYRVSSSSPEWLGWHWLYHNLLVGLPFHSGDYPRLVLYCSLSQSEHTGVYPQSAPLVKDQCCFGSHLF